MELQVIRAIIIVVKKLRCLKKQIICESRLFQKSLLFIRCIKFQHLIHLIF